MSGALSCYPMKCLRTILLAAAVATIPIGAGMGIGALAVALVTWTN